MSSFRAPSIAFVAAVTVGASACAKAAYDDESRTVDAGQRADATPAVDAAPPADAAPVSLTLSHSAAETIDPAASVRCNNNVSGTHADNSYYRVFDLEAQGVDGPFTVSEVRLGIQEATSVDGTGQPASLRLHTLSGDLAVDGLTELVSTDLTVDDQEATMLEVPLDVVVPADAVLVVELFTPDAGDTGHSLWLGANDQGQSAPSYIRSTACEVTEPTDVGTLEIEGVDTTAVHYVLSVVGSYVP